MKKEMELDPLSGVKMSVANLHIAGGGSNSIAPADPVVESKTKCRQFSAADIRSILDEADKGGPGAIAHRVLPTPLSSGFVAIKSIIRL